jgi:hypothetical protein
VYPCCNCGYVCCEFHFDINLHLDLDFALEAIELPIHARPNLGAARNRMVMKQETLRMLIPMVKTIDIKEVLVV